MLFCENNDFLQKIVNTWESRKTKTAHAVVIAGATLYKEVGYLKVNPQDYGHVMYIDASGDDGFKFDRGSSVCYAAAALLVKQEDIAHNLDVLNQIKNIVGCVPTDEVKYSRIRRHRNGNKALSLLKKIRGKMSCYVIFKKEIGQQLYTGSKKMAVVCHLMAVQSIRHYQQENLGNVLIVIDRMKNVEEERIANVINENNQAHLFWSSNATVVFRDSKDKNFLLIQIADLLCGAIRENFEQYESNKDMVYFSKVCPKCLEFSQIKGQKYSICKKGKRRRQRIINSQALKYVYPLFPITNSINMARYFFAEPTSMMDKMCYMLCQQIT